MVAYVEEVTAYRALDAVSDPCCAGSCVRCLASPLTTLGGGCDWCAQPPLIFRQLLGKKSVNLGLAAENGAEAHGTELQREKSRQAVPDSGPTPEREN